MALDLGAIRSKLKEVISSGVERGLNVYDRWPDTTFSSPAIVIFPADQYVAYHEAFSKGLGEVQLELRVFSHSNLSGQEILDDMLSAGSGKANSIIDAIESSRTHGERPIADAPWSDVKVQQAQYIGRTQAEEGSNTFFYAAVVTVSVYVPRS